MVSNRQNSQAQRLAARGITVITSPALLARAWTADPCGQALLSCCVDFMAGGPYYGPSRGFVVRIGVEDGYIIPIAISNASQRTEPLCKMAILFPLLYLMHFDANAPSLINAVPALQVARSRGQMSWMGSGDLSETAQTASWTSLDVMSSLSWISGWQASSITRM